MAAELPEAVFADWAARVEGGEALDFEGLLNEHPKLTSDLRRLHDDWQFFVPLLGRVVPGVIKSSEGRAPPALSGAYQVDSASDSDGILDRLGIRMPSGSRYRFRGVVGHGGGGVVLKVWDTQLGRPLAMKIVLGHTEAGPDVATPRFDARMLTRFVDEARIASQLDHPGIVPVHEIGTDDFGRVFFTMKLVRGETLSSVFSHVQTGSDGWNQTRALGVILKVCEALAFAHERGVVHRDLKPANVMVGRHGEAYVMDWGLARVMGSAPDGGQVPESLRGAERATTPHSAFLTMEGSALGTPLYMSPEQARGEIESVDARSDIYSAGAILYELLAGHAPYVEGGRCPTPHAALASAAAGPPAPLDRVAPRAPAELASICLRAMARERDMRYRTAAHLAADLRAYMEGRVVAAHATGTWAETRKWVGRNRALAVALSAVLVVSSGASIGLWFAASRQADAARRSAASELRSLELSYQANIGAASASLDQANVGEARRLLDACPPQHRGWEWSYIDAIADSSVDTLRVAKTSGHRQFLPGMTQYGGLDIALDREGMSLAVSHARTVAIVDARGPLAMDILGVDFPVTSALNLRNSMLVIGSAADGAINVWNTQPAPFPQARVAAHRRAVRAIAFLCDGQQFVSAGDDGRLRVWGVDVARPVAEISLEPERLTSVACDEVGSWIVAGSESGRLWMWNSQTYAPPAHLDWNSSPVLAVAIDTLGKTVGVGHMDGTIQVGTVALGLHTRTLQGHRAAVTKIMFGPGEHQLVSASADRTVRLWDYSTGENLATYLGHESSVLSVQVASFGRWIYSCSSDGTVRKWDASSRPEGLVLHSTEGGFSPVAASEDGNWLAFENNETVDILESSHAVRAATVTWKEGFLGQLRFTPNSKLLVGIGGGTTVSIWDVKRGVLIESLECADVFDSAATALCLSPNGDKVVVQEGKGSIIVWNRPLGERLVTKNESKLTVSTACFSPDGLQLFASTDNGDLLVVDPLTMKSIRTLTRFESKIRSLAMSPDGERLLVAPRDAQLHMLEANSGSIITSFDVGELEVLSACISNDGARIAGGCVDGTIRIWSVSRSSPLITLRGQEGSPHPARALNFSEDGTRLVSQHIDGTIRVWDSRSIRVRTSSSH